MKSTFTIGTRGSRLALWQAEFVGARLQEFYPQIEIRLEIIKTTGDKLQNVSLTEIGGMGVFVKELETALLGNRIDLAVHSLKDLPTILPEELTIAAVLEREDPRDALILREDLLDVSLKNLPPNAFVGTSSLRRATQLKNLRPDVQIRDLRGNVDTRIRKLDEGNYDAIILAAAGLKRLGLENRISAFLDFEEMLPQIGQGALAIETRNDDFDTKRLLTVLENPQTRAAINAERAFLRELGGGCQFPIAAHAMVENNDLRLLGLVATPDGGQIWRSEIYGGAEDAENLGAELSQILRNQGAQVSDSNPRI